jgi:hypothetical protein
VGERAGGGNIGPGVHGRTPPPPRPSRFAPRHLLLVLPFLIDTAGNALDLYDTIVWWDDFNHFLNWAILVAGFGQLLVRLPVGKLTTAGLVVGFGCVTAVIWEFAEYYTFIRDSPELATAYTDTLGDLALGLTGSVLAAVVTAWWFWPRRQGTVSIPGLPG